MAMTTILQLSTTTTKKASPFIMLLLTQEEPTEMQHLFSLKKDAATAIFNLCIYQGNKSRAVKGGIVDPLTRLLKDAGGGMVDEALAILAILSTNQEGKTAIAEAESIPVLVEIIRTGSPRNRENAAAILWYLCIGNIERLNVAREVGADVALKELTENGTDRAKRKAASLLELIQQTEGVAVTTVP